MSELKIENCIDKEKILELSYTISHIAIASILVICLKNNKSLLLAILLFMMLGFVSYSEQNKMPIYLLISCGIIVYVLDTYVINNPLPNDKNKMKSMIDTIWKVPYWGLVSYYIILAGMAYKTS